MTDNADLLKEARERCDEAYRHERENFDEGKDDLKFAAGEQWDDAAKAIRENRPTLVVNRTGQFRRQIIGDIRLNTPVIKVRPVDGKADKNLANTLTGLIRNIEYASDADSAYITAVDTAATCGYGNFRITTEYSSDDAFDLDIRIRRITNPFAVLWDPAAQEHSREDAKWAFVVTHMTLKDFQATYPKAATTDFDADDIDDGIKDWWKPDSVRVAEYWRKEPITRVLAQLADGSVSDVTGIPPEAYATAPVEIVKTRTVKSHKVVQYLLSGSEVLEGPTPWPGRHIPVIPVWGEEIHIGDRTVRHGVIRFAKDPQRMLNYYRSAEAELVALTPKAPYILTPDQIAGQEGTWQQANSANLPYLLYNQTGATQRPTREPPPQPNTAAIAGAAAVADDLYAVTGIYKPSLGDQTSPESSGKAILARQREGDVGSFVYVDNLSKAIAYAGRQLVDLIPRIYDTERVVRVLGEDGETEIVKLNERVATPAGEVVQNDITIGEYDVVVETGPSFSTRRQESAESMLQFVQAVPQAGQVIGDLIAKNMDWPGAEAIAARLKKILPPGIADPDPGEPPPPPPGPPPELMAKMAELEIKQKTAEAEMAAKEAKTRAEIAALQARTRASIEAAEAKVNAEVRLQAEKMRADLMMQMMAQRHETAMAERQQRQEMTYSDVNAILQQQEAFAKAIGEALDTIATRQAERDAEQDKQIAAVAQAVGQMAERMTAPIVVRKKVVNGQMVGADIERGGVTSSVMIN